MAKFIVGNEFESNIKDTTQVYKATHDGAGNSLPYMNKSFISFSFGDKLIESFDLIVITDGDRIERNAYSSFSDSTTTYETLDGQVYWGSHFEAGQIDFKLATDGMTERQLDDFREWFSPGIERELILSEHPNRAILARIATPPVFSLLPFEKKSNVKINKIDYKTSTTLYRGEISLSFVTDEPFWYSKLTYMPSYIDKITLKELSKDSVNLNKVESLQNKDMLKIMLEDGIPYQENLKATMFLGNDTLAVTSEARTGSAQTDISFLGITIGSTNGLNIDSNNTGYLFYSGTAKNYPTIQFSMKPLINSSNYIYRPRNLISDANFVYSYIKVGNKTFKFTTPSILTGYNQAIQIFKKALNKSSADVFNEIRDVVKEKYSRAWAIACLNALNSPTKITAQNVTDLQVYMTYFIDTETPIIFTINSKTGEAIGKFSIKVLNNISETISKTNFTIVEESVGDMIASDYLVIEGRNYLNSDGEITEDNCKKITSNETLTNVLILFKNMYL